jgi:multidrug efflux system outer membrane protein
MDYPALSVPIPGFSLSSDPYYVASPILSLTQPLWKDFMARGTLATLEKVTASAQMAQTLNRFKIQQILFAAEQAYIQLALAREVVAVQQQSLKNYQSILEWTTRRAARNLVDQVDVLQSQAAMAQVELSLASALETQQSAELEFNTLRGQSDDPKIPTLDPFASPGNAEVGRKQDRADLQAALLDLKAREAAVAEVVNTYQPDVSLFGTLSLNGLDTETAPALAESWSVSHPNATIGIKLSANLDLPLIFKTLEGARLAANAGSQDIKQKRADLQKDWDKLLRRWQSVQERLAVADRLEKLQKAKADREKERFKLGRTTHFQVLRFEEDFSQAKLQRLNLLAEANLIAAQSKLYNNQE